MGRRGDVLRNGLGQLISLCLGVAASRVSLFSSVLLLVCLLHTASLLSRSPVRDRVRHSTALVRAAALPLTDCRTRCKQVGIDQKLNEQLPLDLVFRSEQGEQVKLGDYFGKKPVVLALVYYQCPMLCNQVLNGMVTSFKVLSFKAGEEFEVVTSVLTRAKPPRWLAAKKTDLRQLLAGGEARAAMQWLAFSDWRSGKHQATH